MCVCVCVRVCVCVCVCVCKENLASNNLQWLICHKTNPNINSINHVNIKKKERKKDREKERKKVGLGWGGFICLMASQFLMV